MRCTSSVCGRATMVLAALTLLVATPIVAAGDNTEQRQKLEEELRAAEIAFAKTMADRDHPGFFRFLAAETVFFIGDQEVRGRDAVAAAWKPLFEGPDAPFSWAPDAVAVLDSGRLGLNSGAVRDPQGKTVGTFNSVWRRTAEGKWEIVFDRGCSPCACP